MASRWRTDKPEVGVLVEVWNLYQVIDARWTGAIWQDTSGRHLSYVAYWREKLNV